MKKHVVGLVVLSALAVIVLAALAQPPEGKEKGPGKKGPPPFGKKGPPWEPGKVLPPHVRDLLELSEEQEQQIRDLEKDVRRKLLNIFTEEQKQRLDEIRDKGAKGPPKDRDCPPEKGKDKKKGKSP